MSDGCRAGGFKDQDGDLFGCDGTVLDASDVDEVGFIVGLAPDSHYDVGRPVCG